MKLNTSQVIRNIVVEADRLKTADCFSEVGDKPNSENYDKLFSLVSTVVTRKDYEDLLQDKVSLSSSFGTLAHISSIVGVEFGNALGVGRTPVKSDKSISSKLLRDATLMLFATNKKSYEEQRELLEEFINERLSFVDATMNFCDLLKKNADMLLGTTYSQRNTFILSQKKTLVHNMVDYCNSEVQKQIKHFYSNMYPVKEFKDELIRRLLAFKQVIVQTVYYMLCSDTISMDTDNILISSVIDITNQGDVSVFSIPDLALNWAYTQIEDFSKIPKKVLDSYAKDIAVMYDIVDMDDNVLDTYVSFVTLSDYKQIIKLPQHCTNEDGILAVTPDNLFTFSRLLPKFIVDIMEQYRSIDSEVKCNDIRLMHVSNLSAKNLSEISKIDREVLELSEKYDELVSQIIVEAEQEFKDNNYNLYELKYDDCVLTMVAKNSIKVTRPSILKQIIKEDEDSNEMLVKEIAVNYKVSSQLKNILISMQQEYYTLKFTNIVQFADFLLKKHVIDNIDPATFAKRFKKTYATNISLFESILGSSRTVAEEEANELVKVQNGLAIMDLCRIAKVDYTDKDSLEEFIKDILSTVSIDNNNSMSIKLL